MWTLVSNIFKVGGTGPFGWIGFAAKLLPFLLLMAGVVWGVTQIVSCSTAKLKSDIVIIEQANKELKSANTELAVDNTKTAAQGTATTAIVAEVFEKKIKIIKSTNAREANVTKKIEEINQKYDSVPEKTVDTEKQRADEASTVQIRSAWSAYCEAAPDSTQCAKPASNSPTVST